MDVASGEDVCSGDVFDGFGEDDAEFVLVVDRFAKRWDGNVGSGAVDAMFGFVEEDWVRWDGELNKWRDEVVRNKNYHIEEGRMIIITLASRA